jgi:hypothetical protein
MREGLPTSAGQVLLLGSGYFLLLAQMKKDPDAGPDVGNRIMSIAVLLAEEVSYAF